MDARIPGTSPGKPGHDVGKSTRAGRAMREHRAGAWEFLEWDAARGIPLIPLNPGESRFRINDSRNPVSVSGCDASRPGHSLTPSCPDSFRASTALRRARPMEMAGYPDTRNESGQVRAGPGMTRELRARVGGRVDARIPGTSPGMPGMTGEWSGLARPRASWMPGYPERVRACPGMTGEWPGWRGRAPEPEWGERRERDATATRGSPPRCAPGRG